MKRFNKVSSILATCIVVGSVIGPSTPARADTRHDVHPAAPGFLDDLFGAEDFSWHRFNWFFEQFLRDLFPGGGPSPSYSDLPPYFAMEGDCNLRSPCHVEQDGEDFTLNCRPRRGQPVIFTGNTRGTDRLVFTNAEESQRCRARWRRNGWHGTCVDLPTPEDPNPPQNRCAFNWNETPDPVVFAEQLPPVIDRIQGCGTSYENCTSVQDGASALIRCEDADGVPVYLSTRVNGESIRVSIQANDKNYNCSGEWDGLSASGDCTERGRGITDPDICNDFEFEAESDNPHGECTTQLPSSFSLEGCGMDAPCQAVQRGCEWQLSCGDQLYTGRTVRGRFKFINQDGQRCRLRVRNNGLVMGSCSDRGGGNRCLLNSAAPAEIDPEQCFTMPTQVRTAGCGAFWDDCRVYQDGCNIQTVCNHGQYNFAGQVSGNSIVFQGLADYTCTADLTEVDGVQRLLGACTRVNDDGTVSECRDLSDRFGARLAIDWDQ